MRRPIQALGHAKALGMRHRLCQPACMQANWASLFRGSRYARKGGSGSSSAAAAAALVKAHCSR